MDLRLDGKVALVTGGSKGIGKAIAASYLEAGASVLITARKAEGLEAAAEELAHLAGGDAAGRVAWRAANAGDPAAAEQTVADTIQEFGRLDVLVNNAATNPYAGPMIDVDLARWDKTIQVNLTGPLVWTQAAWKAWLRDNGGVVLNISSVGAFSTNPILGVYDMTKAALLTVTRQLAVELAPGVRVNAVCPGLVKTDFAKVLWEEGRGDVVAQTYPLQRLGEPEDIAGAALYLAADTGRWITGQVLVLDGGGLVAYSH